MVNFFAENFEKGQNNLLKLLREKKSDIKNYFRNNYIGGGIINQTMTDFQIRQKQNVTLSRGGLDLGMSWKAQAKNQARTKQALSLKLPKAQNKAPFL